jgi:bifunctional pyridoxal-dependent enzyme with beta-cystathionase and maltose regulon repressor activities
MATSTYNLRINRYKTEWPKSQHAAFAISGVAWHYECSAALAKVSAQHNNTQMNGKKAGRSVSTSLDGGSALVQLMTDGKCGVMISTPTYDHHISSSESRERVNAMAAIKTSLDCEPRYCLV